MKQAIRAIVNSYSEIFFIQGLVPGLIIAAISFLNPNSAIAGLLAVLVAFLFAQFIGFRKEFLSSGFYTYNPLLVGLSIGYMFKLHGVTLVLLASASILAFLLTVFLYHFFSVYLHLQILSIPFVLVSSLVYLAAGRFSNLMVTSLYAPRFLDAPGFIPDVLANFFRAVGAIVFMPNAVTGLLLCLLILWSSRILFVLAVAGYFVGGLVQGLYIGSFAQAYADLNSFNYILIAMAIGGIFLIPSIQSIVLALVGVAVSTLLSSSVTVFWAQYGIPVFTLPFTLVTLSFVYVLGLVNYRLRPALYKATPEETLDHYLTTTSRFSTAQIFVSLPFLDHWTVWQGFDGKWTHQGMWMYGVDFVKTDAAGQTFNGSGSQLADYYCFGQAVTSPIRGQIVAARMDLPDNPIGAVDHVNNWGNYVIIQSQFGWCVELSHLAQNSIPLPIGSWVEVGTQIGLCGNSGYSPQPHIHMQVQAGSALGEATLPFEFEAVQEGSQAIAHMVPTEKAVLLPLQRSLYQEQLTTFVLDDELTFQVQENGQDKTDVTWTVRMAPDSTFYLDAGNAKLYFGKRHNTFYCYHMEGRDPYLRALYYAMPRVPLSYSPQLTWVDSPSSYYMFGSMAQLFSGLQRVIAPHLLRSEGRYSYVSETDIEGTVTLPSHRHGLRTHVKLDPAKQLSEITFGDLQLKRRL